MDEMIFTVFRFVLLVALAVLMKYIIPYLQKLVDNSELRYLRQIVCDAVMAAEQTVSTAGAGAEKKRIVTEFLKNMLISKNISVSDQQIDSLIESAVYMFNISKKREEKYQMSKDTELEVIKALAYGTDIEEIANMAEADVEEIIKIQENAADEISIRHKELEAHYDK